MSDHTQDRRQVQKLLAGDPAEFDAFFARYFPRLYRFVLPRVEHRADAAQDVCQVVLTRALRRMNSYRGEAALFTWLCQIARNELADYWRLQRRDAARVVSVDDDANIRAVLESLQANEVDGPEAQRYGEELGRAVQITLDHLPEHYGDALEWKYLDGLSIVEIGGRLGLSVPATQSVLQRARVAFRETFGVLAEAVLKDVLGSSGYSDSEA